ncbi:MAG: YkgJ family cysteine cluster protein [Sedimentisphaerales bacterium]|nr:YkgJ family cysteine cluster protein [Sedimentisphaerales bacterium]
MSLKKENPWYVGGLHFECMQCGRCCSGPGEGYIWVTKPEIELIADFLKMSVGELRKKYMRRVSFRTTIIEHCVTKDCIFLQNIDGQKRCAIYHVRPSQCRTWPFWSDNLANPNDWNKAAEKCPGINRGKLYTCEEIEKIKGCKKWWQVPKRTEDSVKK